MGRVGGRCGDAGGGGLGWGWGLAAEREIPRAAAGRASLAGRLGRLAGKPSLRLCCTAAVASALPVAAGEAEAAGEGVAVGVGEGEAVGWGSWLASTLLLGLASPVPLSGPRKTTPGLWAPKWELGLDWDLGGLYAYSQGDNAYIGMAFLYIVARIALGKRTAKEILLPRVLLRFFRSRLWRRNTTNIYKTLPLRMSSRVWGWVNDIPLWRPLRSPLLGLYVRAFGCDMAEAEVEELSEYPNLSALFNRRLKAGLRPVGDAPLVSPADGTVQGHGLIHDGMVEQVKGINYPLAVFLGQRASKELRAPKEDVCLHYVTLYLAPGDYHAFHSPADWEPETRVHFTGQLLSVSGWVMERVADIMTLNERVLLWGRWPWGFFSYTAVGATNVGRIYLDEEPELRTNLRGKGGRASERPLSFRAERGQRLGEFRLGSSVVLVFQAPKDFAFLVPPGSKVRYGQALGHVPSQPSKP